MSRFCHIVASTSVPEARVGSKVGYVAGQRAQGLAGHKPRIATRPDPSQDLSQAEPYMWSERRELDLAPRTALLQVGLSYMFGCNSHSDSRYNATAKIP